MRFTLLALSLFGLTCFVVGCDSAATKEATPAGAPIVTSDPAEPAKGGMDGPPPAAQKTDGAASVEPGTTSTPTPAPEAKNEEMPK